MGPDDPFQCPQLYQPQYCHYACILKRIEDLNDPRWIMWWTPKETELRPDAVVPGRYSVEYTHRTLFKFCVAKLVDEFLKDKDSFRTQTNSQWVNMLVNQLQTWYNRLSAFTTSFPNVLFLVAEVQRRWLDLRAYIDYMVIVKGELSKLRASSPKFPSCRPFIGAITYSHTVAEEFATTGVPVWLVRDLSEFSPNVRIQSLVALQATKLVVVEPFPGVSQAIYVGSSDSCEKYDSIYKYSRQHFALAYEVERPAQPPSAADDASERPAKRFKTQTTAVAGSKARALPAPNDKDIAKFHPSDHPFWPPILPAWRDALAAVNHSNSRVSLEWAPGDSGYRFPDPHLFVPPSLHNINKRISSYYITCHPVGTVLFRFSLLYYYPMAGAPLTLYEGGWMLSFKVNSGAEGRMSKMTALLQQWVAKHQIKIATPDAGFAKVRGSTLTLDVLPPADVARMIVYVLCELNFRSELRALDTYMHISSPSRRRAVERTHYSVIAFLDGFLAWRAAMCCQFRRLTG
ncbi:CxC2 domain-containing protein [Salix suchowensis]|nr:CxC2 domain-containing protein [Salix suchowensis]